MREAVWIDIYGLQGPCTGWSISGPDTRQREVRLEEQESDSLAEPKLTVAMAPAVFLELATPLLQPKYTPSELAVKFDDFESMAKAGTLTGPHLMLDKTTGR